MQARDSQYKPALRSRLCHGVAGLRILCSAPPVGSLPGSRPKRCHPSATGLFAEQFLEDSRGSLLGFIQRLFQRSGQSQRLVDRLLHGTADTAVALDRSQPGSFVVCRLDDDSRVLGPRIDLAVIDADDGSECRDVDHFPACGNDPVTIAPQEAEPLPCSFDVLRCLTDSRADHLELRTVGARRA